MLHTGPGPAQGPKPVCVPLFLAALRHGDLCVTDDRENLPREGGGSGSGDSRVAAERRVPREVGIRVFNAFMSRAISAEAGGGRRGTRSRVLWALCGADWLPAGACP